MHECTHWVMGELLGYEMIMTLNIAYPAKLSYDKDWHYTLISAVGPLITLLQALIIYLIIKRTSRRNLYPFLESRSDMIIGFHMFKQGDTIVESSISYVSTNYSDNHSTITGVNVVGIDNPNELICSITNIAKNKSGDLKLVINSSLNQLTWTLKNREGIKIGNYDFTFSYPRSITLQKQ